MIAQLRGTVSSLAVDTGILDVGGVGYEFSATPKLLSSLNAGDVVTLSIETVVREDFIKLYGFSTMGERSIFRTLQSVQGVGAKHALSIMQVLSPNELYEAIAAEDVTAVSRAHGVGKKIAQRIVTELQTKLGAMADSVSVLSVAQTRTPPQSSDMPVQPQSESVPIGGALRMDATSALVNLGFDSVAARRAVNTVISRDALTTLDDVIPVALRELS